MGVMRAILAALTIVASGACASHDHKSVRTYDYREDDDAQRPSQSDPRAGRSEPSSEYQMVSPGEMTPTGKPVVNPR